MTLPVSQSGNLQQQRLSRRGPLGGRYILRGLLQFILELSGLVVITFVIIILVTPALIATFGFTSVDFLSTFIGVTFFLKALLVNPSRPGFHANFPKITYDDFATVVIVAVVTLIWFPLVWLVTASTAERVTLITDSPLIRAIVAFWFVSWLVLLGRTLSLGYELKEAIEFQLSPGTWSFGTGRQRLWRVINFVLTLWYMYLQLMYEPSIWFRHIIRQNTTHLLTTVFKVPRAVTEWTLRTIRRAHTIVRNRQQIVKRARTIAKTIESLILLVILYTGVQLALAPSPNPAPTDWWPAVTLGAILALICAYYIGGIVRRGLEQLGKVFAGAAKLQAPILVFVIGYFAIVFTFAGWFSLLQRQNPRSFCGHYALVNVTNEVAQVQAVQSTGGGLEWAGCVSPSSLTYGDFLFLSLTTFSTVGYGWNTVMPLSQNAQLLVALEPVVAFMWLGVAFAVLINHLTAPRRTRAEVIADISRMIQSGELAPSELLGHSPASLEWL